MLSNSIAYVILEKTSVCTNSSRFRKPSRICHSYDFNAYSTLILIYFLQLTIFPLITSPSTIYRWIYAEIQYDYVINQLCLARDRISNPHQTPVPTTPRSTFLFHLSEQLLLMIASVIIIIKYLHHPQLLWLYPNPESYLTISNLLRKCKVNSY